MFAILRATSFKEKDQVTSFCYLVGFSGKNEDVMRNDRVSFVLFPDSVYYLYVLGENYRVP